VEAWRSTVGAVLAIEGAAGVAARGARKGPRGDEELAPESADPIWRVRFGDSSAVLRDVKPSSTLTVPMMDLEGEWAQLVFCGGCGKSGIYDTLRASESTLTHGYPFGGVRVFGGKFPWSYGYCLRRREPKGT
jgi:hypothetical protein